MLSHHTPTHANPSHATLCRSCGYDLVGLEPAGLCPECGDPIAHSLRSDALSNSSPQWVSRILRGSNFLLWATISQILLIVLGLPALHVMFGILSLSTAYIGLAVSIAIVALSILGYTGVWLLTTPDPRNTSARASHLAMLARWSMISSLGLAYIGYAARVRVGVLTPDFIALLLALIYSVACLFTLLYMRTLFLRMGLYARASSARFVAWSIPSTFIASVATGALLTSIGNATGPAFFVGVPTFCGAVIFLLVLIIAAIVVLGQLVHALEQTSKYIKKLAERSKSLPQPPPDSA